MGRAQASFVKNNKLLQFLIVHFKLSMAKMNKTKLLHVVVSLDQLLPLVEFSLVYSLY